MPKSRSFDIDHEFEFDMEEWVLKNIIRIRSVEEWKKIHGVYNITIMI